MSWRFGLKAFLLILTLIAVLLGCHLRVDKQTRQLVGEISQGKTDRMLDAHLDADLLTDHELFLQKETGFMPMTESLPASFLDLLLMKRRFRVTFSTTLRTTTSDDVQQVTWFSHDFTYQNSMFGIEVVNNQSRRIGTIH